MKVVIVGAGVMGLCSAWALHRAGHAVTIYDQGPIPNPRGSSFDQHRLIRFVYGERAGYARMVREAYAAWECLWDDLGTRHYRELGTLVVVRGASEWAERSLSCLAKLALPVERLNSDQIAARVPMVDPAGVAWALWTPTGGMLFAERIVRDLARHLQERGVAVHPRTPVAAIDPARAAVHLGDGRSAGADLLVVAAGPWVPRLVAGLRGRVRPSRQVAVYLDPPAGQVADWASAPAIFDQSAEGEGFFYAVPPLDDGAVKIGDHRFSLAGHPDHAREPTPEDVRAVLTAARGRLRAIEQFRLREARTCYYSVTGDERFIAETVDNALILAGFSGHGFKFGAALGEAVAAAVEGRRSFDDLRHWAAGHG